MERARAQEAATRIEISRQNQQLKSALLDALAHEFKTPLTSVKIAATTMLLHHTLGELEYELITVINEETDRMTNLVTDAIELARIGTGPVTLNKELCAAEQMIGIGARRYASSARWARNERQHSSGLALVEHR